jgi:uncharacterized membrane-anchored protein
MITENKLKTMMNKVPEVTIFFWIIKVLCTTVGETFSDFLNVNLGFGLTGTSIIMGIVLAVVLVVQFKGIKYVPGVYWLTVVLISVFGTLVTDNLTDALGVPLEISTIVLSILLLITFIIWYKSEKTLSIHSIFTTKREMFYWLSILFTFALGTATGDLLAEGLGLGYLTTGLIVCGVIVTISVLWKLGMDAILSFWMIYIMTRPLGASIGDLLSQNTQNGGLGFGATITSVIFLIGILAIVIFLTLTKKDVVSHSAENDAIHRWRLKPLAQTLILLGILVLLSCGGYYFRQQSLISSNTTITWSDVSDFTVIEEDTLTMVNNGDLGKAKTRIKDLETAWDDASAYLKGQDKNRWSEVDKSIDELLHALRTSKPNAITCKTSIEKSLNLLRRS